MLKFLVLEANADPNQPDKVLINEDAWRMRPIFMSVSVCVIRVHIYLLCHVHGK